MTVRKRVDLFIVSFATGITMAIALFVYQSHFDKTLSEDDVTQTLVEYAWPQALEESPAVILQDGYYDDSFFEVNLHGIDIEEGATRHTRPVVVSVTYLYNDEDMKTALGVDELPEGVLSQRDEDGFWPREVANSATLGVLVGDRVYTSSLPFASAVVSEELWERVLVRAVLLPNSENEDAWRTEVLFEGTARSFLRSTRSGINSYYRLAMMTRPDEKLLPAFGPGEFYAEADTARVVPRDQAIYVRLVNGVMIVSPATVTKVFDGDRKGQIYVEGSFTNADIGSPFFVLRDGEPEFVGVFLGVLQNDVGLISSDVYKQQEGGGE